MIKMNSCIVILSVISSVLCVQVHNFDEIFNKSGLWNNNRREDRWDWGYATEPNRILNKQRGSIATTPEPDPCESIEYIKPNFTTSGRRISETKCYEYIWEMKMREEHAKRQQECFNIMIKNAGPDGPFFAIGGRDTEPGEFPQMGAIGWEATVGTWIFKCGSSLISPKFILTAAHCSSASTKDTTIADVIPKIVRLGDKNILNLLDSNPIIDKKIIKIIVHPQYAAPKKYYDIALMELESEVVFTKYIQPGCLWSNPDITPLGSKGTLTGWGVIDTGSRRTSPELQAAEVDIIDSTTCDKLLRSSCNRHWCGIQDHQLCAGKLTGGVDACQGDSGGPLQVKIPLPIKSEGNMNYIFGVTSFGIGCALENLPGIYTKVSSFTDWIENIVWQ